MRSKQMASVKYAQEFKDTFELVLKDYMDHFTGFDLTRFGEDTKCPYEVSISDHIFEKYGDSGRELICHLIAI